MGRPSFPSPSSWPVPRWAAPPADLSSVRAECTGLNSGQTYAGTDESNFTLQPNSGLCGRPLYRAGDIPDYLASTPNPLRRDRSAALWETARHHPTRAGGGLALPATPTVLATYTGPQTVTVNDSYAQHYEETRYYRLRITRGTCSRLVGPQVVMTSSGRSSGLAGGLNRTVMASQLARRAIARSTWAEQRPRRASWRFVRRPWIPRRPVRCCCVCCRRKARWCAASRCHPTDLPGLTNAKSVAAADYLDESGQRVASLLLVETQGEVYEHSKMLCDRAGAACWIASMNGAWPLAAPSCARCCATSDITRRVGGGVQGLRGAGWIVPHLRELAA